MRNLESGCIPVRSNSTTRYLALLIFFYRKVHDTDKTLEVEVLHEEAIKLSSDLIGKVELSLAPLLTGAQTVLMK